jgi:hypothetical protein
MQLGAIALAAGVCAVAAGVWSSRRDKAWLLVLNGLALSALGLLCVYSNQRFSFRTVALLLAVMAVSMGLVLLGFKGAASLGFALAFGAVALPWVHPAQPESTFLLVSAYFGFSAVCMVGLALRTATISETRRV